MGEETKVVLPVRPAITRTKDIAKTDKSTIDGVDDIGGAIFSPGQPMRQMAGAEGEGRRMDFPIGYNIRLYPITDSGIEFWELRALAETHDVTRLLIETRKDQLEALEWSVRARKDPDLAMKDPDVAERVDQTIEFLRKPDGVNEFGSWMRELAEDLLVLDAPAVYVNRDKLGDTRFEIMDGGILKRLIDIQGRTPEPPDPAFLQIIKGMPYRAYDTNELIYMPRNRRPNRIYGMSPVQQIVILVNIALRREMSQLEYYCYSDDTEVFTKRGWLKFSECDKEDVFATRQIGSGLFEWQKAYDFFCKPYKGKMIQFKGRSLDLLVTPHHRMLVNSLPRALSDRRPYRASEHVITAEEMMLYGTQNTKVPQAAKWLGEEIEQKVFIEKYTGRSGPDSKIVHMTGDQYCAFMGMYLAEGSIKRTQIQISQPKDRRGSHKLYRKLLTDIFGSTSFSGHQLYASGRALTNFLKGFGKSHEKFIPADILKATPRQLRIFWKYYYMGDGAASGDEHGSQQCFTVSERLANDLTELLQKIGRSVTYWKRSRGTSKIGDRAITARAGWMITIGRRKATGGWVAKTVDYDAPVACVCVPNKFLFVRRNGKTAWSGNTEGNIPDAFIGTPEGWSPQQIAEFQKNWDALLEGNTAQRRKAKFVPGKADVNVTRKIDLKDEFDEWLARVACFAFSVPPTAFVKMVNRGTAGVTQEAAQEEGLAPLMRWVKRVMDRIIQDYLEQDDLEFVFTDTEETNQETEVSLIDTEVRNGTMTINEARAERGRPPIEGGDQAMIFTGTGPILVSSIKAQADASLENQQVQNDDKNRDPETEEQEKEEDEQTKAGDEDMGDGKDKQTKKITKRSDRKSLYIRRPLLNADEVIAWAKDNGFETCLPPEDMHATIIYSKDPVDWNMAGKAVPRITVRNGTRDLEQFDEGAIVLRFSSFRLANRNQQLRDIGATSKWPTFQPHVTLTYEATDIEEIEPYDGPLIFGPEIWEEIKDKAFDPGQIVERAEVAKTRRAPFGGSLTKAYSEDQPRNEKGEWTSGGDVSAAEIKPASEFGKERLQSAQDFYQSIRKDESLSQNQKTAASFMVNILSDRINERPGDYVIATDKSGNIIGAAHFTDDEDGKSTILEHLASFGKGGGTKLLQAGLDRASSRGVKTVKFETMPGAKGFYNKLGFSLKGGRFFSGRISSLAIMKVMDGQERVFQSSNGRGIAWDVEPVPHSSLPGSEQGEPSHDGSVKKVKKRWVTLARMPFRSDLAKGAEEEVQKLVMKVFKETAPKVAAEVVRQLEDRQAKVGKATSSDELVIDLSGLASIPQGATTSQLKKVSAAGAQQAIAIIGAQNNSDLVNQVNSEAEAFAEYRAAELVGMKWIDGELVENPNAKWAIDDTTREQIRSLVSTALQTGQSFKDLAKDIQDASSFSDARAMMVARTEVMIAQNAGAMIAWRTAADALNIQFKKRWIAFPTSCDVCIDLEDDTADNPIDLDEDFQDPDGEFDPVDAPPLHPHCRCTVSMVVPEEDLPPGAQTMSDDDE